MTELVKKRVLTAGLQTILRDTMSVLTWIWGTTMELMATFPVDMEFTKIVDATSEAVLTYEVGERLRMEFWTVQEEAVNVEAVKFVVTMESFTWSEFV
jgi:transposase